ncbi:MAG: tetratricopeptide repeat protein [Cyanothece sp. SIO1E1]|nr:tetratricopeptide repeat protein [Cyanothece sp. SIO1E1]
MAEAEAVFSRALGEKEQRFGREHPALASSYFHLGQIQLRRGHREAAEALFMRANELSANHPGSHQMMESLAFSLRDQDRVDALEQRYLFELESYEIELGSDHPALLHALDNLGLLYRYQGRYEDAIEIFLQVLVIREGQPEQATLAIQQCVEQLVYCYRAEARNDDADALLEQYSDYLDSVSGN